MRLLVPLVVVLLVARTAPALTFVVDDAGEAHDASPGDGTCATAGATCTLVAAMDEANAHPDMDVIQLPPGTYTYTATLPTVVSPMTIEPTTGTDPSATVIHSSDTGHPRLFDVGVGGDLTLDALTLDNAQTGLGSAVRVTSASATLTNCVVTNNAGTALYANTSSSLTLASSVVSDNTSAIGPGGMWVDFSNVAVSNTTFSGNSGTLGGAGFIYTSSDNSHTDSITGSTFSGNSSTNSGGALYVGSDTVTIDGSTFTGNTSSHALYGGGAIYAAGVSPGTVITNSTFSGNQATAPSGGDGGALFVLNLASCRGCTFSGNSATASGGAVFAGANDGAEFDAVDSTFSGNTAFGGGALSTSATLRLASVTITNNTATGGHNVSDGNGSFGGGGGTNGLDIRARNTIVAGNSSPLGGADCEGQITGPGYDLVGDDTNCSVTAGPGPNQVGTGGSPIDPGLGALANNGGPTETCALVASSPAGDAGNPSGCTDNDGIALTTDQRGQPRTVDGDSDGTARCDIGAYEAPEGTFPTPTTTTVTTTTTTTATTTTTSTTVTTTTSTTATTSTSTSTSTTSTVTTTTRTTTTAAPTTTTTLPPGGCDAEPVAATFASIDCRLAALLARVNGTPALGQFAGRLAQDLGKAKSDTEAGRMSCASSDAKHARQRLKQAIRMMIQYHHQLVTTAARKKIAGVRQDFADAGTPIQTDLKTLRTNVACPSDA